MTVSEPAAELSPLKRALLAIDDLRSRLDAAERARTAPIAIVGMGCRFPGASTVDALWELIRDGVDAIRPVPADRWDVERYFDPDPLVPGKLSHREGGFLDDVRTFDPAFFGISPREAVSMDPQQRILLEVAWEALEHAGIAPDRLGGSRTGVFIGTAASDYVQVHLDAAGLEGLDAYHASGTARSIASGRLAYVLGLRGPAISIDTACSSSLVAIHLAVQSLRAGEADLALAGGVNLILSPDNSITLSKYQMLAPDSRCKAFDAAADGFGRGEGCGLVVLKRLDDALAAGDRVLAVVRGSAVNQDGASSGLTAPNGPSQESVLRDALADAGVSAASVQYVEAHGTGTALGDPIEAQAIGAVLGEGRPVDSPVAVGSVKTNLGHLECAAGVAGVMKAVLALQHGAIPPHLHLHEPSPHIDWESLPIVIPTELTEWPGGGPRRAGVSAFGFSGTNAHVILEAAPETAAAPPAAAQSLDVLALSARSPEALRELARRYADHIHADAGLTLADICATANAGRAHLDHRAAFVAATLDELHAQLAAFVAGEHVAGVTVGARVDGDPPRVGFLYTGQGSQSAGMGRGLYECEPVFRAAVDRCVAASPGIDVSAVPGWTGAPTVGLLGVMFAADGSDGAGLIDQTAVTQPALFVLEVALAELWRSWGVEPAALLGHSVGELAAAVAAGVLTPEDGMRLVSQRGRLMQQLPPGGAMAAVFADHDAVAGAVTEVLASSPGGSLGVAAVNGPAHVVVSGDSQLVDRVRQRFAADGTRVQELLVSHAFHSTRMAPMLEEFAAISRSTPMAPPSKRIVSNVTGATIGPEIADPMYWVRHVEAPVRFADGIAALHARDITTFVEIGPHPVLLGMARDCPAPAGGRPAAWVPSLRRAKPDQRHLYDALAAVYVAGTAVDWAAFARGRGGRRVDLPTYPFERQEHWVTPRSGRRSDHRPSSSHHPLLGERVESPLAQVSFAAELATDTHPYLDDHRVFDRAILPATGFVEAALAGAATLAGAMPGGGVAVADLVIHEALIVADGEQVAVQTIFGSARSDATFEIFSRPSAAAGGAWTRHVSGRIAPARSAAGDLELGSLDAARLRCTTEVTAAAHYAGLTGRQLVFGPSLRGVTSIRTGVGEAVGRIELPESLAADAGRYRVHPALLDAAIQVLAAVTAESHDTYLPINIDRVTAYGPTIEGGWSHVRLRPGVDLAERPDIIAADIVLHDDDGRPVAAVEGLRLKRADAAALLRMSARDPIADWLYEITWDHSDAATTSSGAAEPLALDIAAVATAAAQSGERRGDAHEIVAYQGLLDALERVSTAYIAAALTGLGADLTVGARFAASALAVAGQHRKLLDHLVDFLVHDGIVVPDGDGFSVARHVDPVPDDAEWSRLAARYPRGTGELAITRRCGEHLADALSGRADPLDLLFPGGSLESAEQMYQVSPFAHHYNALAADAVASVVAAAPAGRHLRVLEIGAGTGGTSAYVLPQLPPGRCEYTYTDVSPHFTVRARAKFAQYPFVEYRTLDIEGDLAAQGFAAGQYDIVVAANVLHATADLRHTFANVARLLAPGGVVAMVEMVVPLRFIAITFGLTDGWWKFVDTDLRPESLLLDGAGWESFLETAGFAAPRAIAPLDRGTDPLASPSAAPSTTAIQALVVAGAPADAGRSDAGSWLVVGDQRGTASELAAALVAAGGSATVADHADPQTIRTALAAPPPSGWSGVVHLAGLDAAGAASVAELERPITSLLATIQAVIATRPLPLVLVTRGAQAVHGGTPDPGQAPVWGVGRVIALEHPELRCRRIDLDPSAGVDLVTELVSALTQHPPAAAGGDEVAVRNGTRYESRITRCGDLIGTTLPDAVALALSPAGVLEELAVTPTERRAPGPGEVEILVRAAGLNFRDVMNALAMRDDQEPIGSECAGVIVAVGDDVDQLHVGDAVVAVAPGSFATYVTTAASLAVRKPERLTFQQAATIPLAFLTAVDALESTAAVRPAETVLVHAAAGGVGLAAIQVARRAGASVLATAGSIHKRSYLRSLGVDHVGDSRSADFGPAAVAATGGRGADVVLNSLTGPLITAGIAALGVNGRFVELGKREILQPSEVAAINPGAAYLTIGLAERIRDAPERVGAALAAIMADVEAGALEPLPAQAFLLSEAPAAFRAMAQARHIGKIVLVPDSTHDSIAVTPAIRPDVTYLVTGGLAGLGLLVAEWLIEHGATHLALLGRRAPAESAAATIDRLRSSGAEVLTVLADAGDPDQLAGALDRITGSMPELRGVFHCAGTLDDAALARQDWPHFVTVLHPKVNGAAALDRLTATSQLDHFVLFSSAAALVGSRGQANHAAANSYLDALAGARRHRGQAGLSINWGGWSDVGSVETHGLSARLAANGIGLMTPTEGLLALERLLVQGRANVGVVPIDWQRFLASLGDAVPPMFAVVATGGRRQPTETAAPPPAVDLGRQLAAAIPAQRFDMLLDFVRGHAARVLGAPAAAVDERKPLNELGLDSLMAVELRNMLGEAARTDLPATLVFDHPTVHALASHLATLLDPAGSDAAAPEAPGSVLAAAGAGDDLLASIEQMSDDEVADLLEEHR